MTEPPQDPTVRFLAVFVLGLSVGITLTLLYLEYTTR